METNDNNTKIENGKNNVEIKVRPQNKHLKPIKPGETRNPNGRPKGQRDYATIYREALIKLAQKAGMDDTELETEILMKGLTMARKGDYKFFKDVLDRIHGQPKQSVDHTTAGKELPTPIMPIIRDTGSIDNGVQSNNSNTENSEPN